MLDNMEVAKIQQSNMESSLQKISAIRYLRSHSSVKDTDLVSREREDTTNNGKRLDSPSMQKSVVDSARFSWIKRCTELIFKSSPEKPLLKSEEKSLISIYDAILASASKLDSSNGYHGQKLKSIESSGNRQPMRYAIGEPEVTPEPPEDETAKGKRDKESETKKDANEEIAPSFSEQARPAGRKRRVKNSPLNVSTDPQPEQRQNNKRRRQQKGAAVNLSISKDANNPSLIHFLLSVWLQPINAPEDQHLTEGAEDADVVIAERIIKISEASEVTCDYCDVQDGGTNGNSNEKCVERSVVPCSSEVSVMLKIKWGMLGKSHEDASKTSDLRVEDSAVARSDNSEKVATCWRYWKEDKIKTEVIQF
ncbi:hypothetical protein GH714_016030 [Hevea brasiliensis]|uniref:Uncharacterized protein n=1 Tax=Hevea brasiliensis TaxID=3981 RepID=A0A6A6K5W7_HEVBR|nr:hypothetical protein GH714_016030 [Hevea brasiliensis]